MITGFYTKHGKVRPITRSRVSSIPTMNGWVPDTNPPSQMLKNSYSNVVVEDGVRQTRGVHTLTKYLTFSGESPEDEDSFIDEVIKDPYRWIPQNAQVENFKIVIVYAGHGSVDYVSTDLEGIEINYHLFDEHGHAL